MSQNSVLAAVATVLPLLPSTSRTVPSPPASLQHGFYLLYNCDFSCAQQEFTAWQELHPEDPLGPVAEAWGHIFSEFIRLRVFEIPLLIRDSSYRSTARLSPDPAVDVKFEAALQKAETMAWARLAKDSRDRDALFAMTLASGLRADYQASLKNAVRASLLNASQSRTWGQRLLAADPNYYDAYLAYGSCKYIVRDLATICWVLRMQGVCGDKKEGLQELKLTAAHGRYLAPLARILLAVAYLCNKDIQQARQLLSALAREFPDNPLFPAAIAHLEPLAR